MEPPAWRIVHSIRSVQFILGWIWNTPYTEQLLRFAYNLICLKVANALWQCWYQVRPKQWRAVGLAELLKTSTYQREICVLTPCPRAEQIPCICDELMGHWPCLKVVCFRYVSGIVSMSLHLSSCMGVFQTCSCDVFHDQDQYLMQYICFGSVLRSGNSIPRSLYDNHLCGYGAPWVSFYRLHWKMLLMASLCSIDA